MMALLKNLRVLRMIAGSSLIALIMVCLAWEGWLAPLRPDGSWLILKAAPLLLPLPGIIHGRRYTYQWSCMFILLYFMEGIVRTWADGGASAGLATIEVLLSLIFFISTILYAKFSAKPARL